MTQHVVVLLIMNMGSAKSAVKGPKKKYAFGVFKKKKVTKKQPQNLIKV